MYSPRGGGNSGGPGPNALTMPIQQQTTPLQNNNAIAGNFGSGLMQGAIDVQKQYPIWQQQYLDGTTTLQFPEWLKGQGQNNPVMPAQPKQQNSMGYMPRGYG
jgi:hypothetical protein